MYSEKRKFGNIGEAIAERNLLKRGYSILERNYLKKWGEIDIVARGTDRIVHFVEVKTVSREKSVKFKKGVTRETWRPEDNVHPQKLKKIQRAVSSWIMENKYDGEWQLDIAAIELDLESRTGKIRWIENVI